MRAPRAYIGDSIVRLDPAYRQRSIMPDFDRADWAELNALVNRNIETPRAYLNPERVAQILQQPPVVNGYSNSGRRAGEIEHGSAVAYAYHRCRCTICQRANATRGQQFRNEKKKREAGGK